jgi:two-component system chemotaxis response regulator CheB
MSDALENTLWTALRMMEERKNLLDKMAKEENKKGWRQTAATKSMRADELHQHIDRLKQILFESRKD